MGHLSEEMRRGCPVRGSGRIVIDIRKLLEWAFQTEKARLEFAEDGFRAHGFGFTSSTAGIIEHERLGCRIDGGGISNCHPDADQVAAFVSGLSVGHGGRQMAVWVADLARTGRVPDWMPDSQPRFFPADVHTNRYGRRAKTEDAASLGDSGWKPQPRRNRKQVIVHEKVLYCPVVCRPMPSEIARARRAYSAWCLALADIHAAVRAYGRLVRFELLPDLPDPRPWRRLG